MASCKTLILEYSSQNTTFGIDDLCNWISAIAKYSRNTVACLLLKLVEAGDLIRIERGLYSKAANKSQFRAIPTEKEIAIVEKLKQKFPFAPLCVYNGSVLSSIQHHLSANNITYIETDRSAIEAVFNYLKENDDRVWMTPDADFIYRYVNLAKGGIIIKPLVTESPIQTINGISTPTLEKLLIDVRKDPDFSYFLGAEADRMLENAINIYAVNKTRLNRYARRRGITNLLLT